jgi:predicted ester cyclase
VQPENAEGEDRVSETNEATLRAAIAAFNDPERRERYLDLYDPGVVLHGYPRGLEGREGAKRFYTRVWEAFPDAQLTIEDVIASDDRLAVRYTLSGIQAQDFYGLPVSGTNTTTVSGVAWLRFADGRAVEVWQASATLDMVTRLAARAASAPGQTRPSASAEAAALRWQEQHADE